MRLYRPGIIPWQETQGIYHALAEDGQEALVLCRPASRYVCLGFHDDLEQEIDRDYCERHTIPLLRRETGGGVVLLDSGQLFFQLVLHKDNPLLSGRRDRFFTSFLQPVVDTLRDYGLDAAVRLPADIVVKGRKISGNGAGDIGECAVYIGNILLEFDRETMAGVLKAPNEDFRHQVRQSMENELTAMGEELGFMPDANLLEDRLADRFARMMGMFEAAEYSSGLKAKAQTAAQRLISDETLSMPGRKLKARQVKIREGVYLRLHQYRDLNHKHGYAIILIEDGMIRKFDCFDVPHADGLTGFVTGAQWREQHILAAVKRWRSSRASIAAGECNDDLITQWIMEGVG